MSFRSLFLCAALPFVVPSFFLAACGGETKSDSDEGDPPGPETSKAGKTSSCRDFCEASQACVDLDVADCTKDCAEGDSISRAGQEALAACFDEDACALDEVAGLGAVACVLEKLEDVELSDAARTYCESSVAAINACSDAEPVEIFPGGCTATIALTADELLQGLNECAELSCEDQQSCIELEILKALPLSALIGLQSGELSPAALGDLLALGVVFSQLSLQGGAVINPEDFGFGAGGASN